jgi:hypothetical protein
MIEVIRLNGVFESYYPGSMEQGWLYVGVYACLMFTLLFSRLVSQAWR